MKDNFPIAKARQMADNRRQMARQNSEPLVLTPRQAIETIRQGYPADRLDELAQELLVERPVLLLLLGVSERTWQRKAHSAARLSPAVSDRLARLERIILLASEAFGSKEKAVEWLKRSSRALGSEVPLHLLDTDAGAQRVERELRQIQYGFVY